ncbi:MAG TPA: apolipoprotein N-acyltransferase [Bradyrhizobium sp.]|nr:apolipoprotein N-acyltransferase [Bradyrhizobium sp.]
MNIRDKFRAAALSIILAWGWKRAAIAFAAGVLSALAMAPFNAWPILFLTFPILVWLIDGAAAGKWRGVPAAALSGFCFGFGYFVPGLYWTGYAFFVDAPTFAWLSPFAVLGLPAYLALYPALGFALARLLWTRDASRILALAIALTVSEWLRGHLLTGFPWNAYGYALSEPLALAQIASVIGLWGMTFLAVAIFASPAVLIEGKSRRRPWIAPIAALATLLALGAFGVVRLSLLPTKMVSHVKLRIMQPNLQQDVKFNYSAKQQVMQKYLALSDRASGPQSTGVRDASILIWPESAFPFFLTREADAMAQIADLLPKGTVLITGAVRVPDDARPGVPVTRAYNSIYVIDHDGSVLSVYDKTHLVPFGEYLPFQNLMERLGFTQLTKVQGGYIPGTRRRPLDIPNAPRALPLICYEAIFPGNVADRDDRAGWIVNLTNDGWFGISTGPYQHLQQARLRAIEEGLPVVRAANTGISAVIDPMGRIVAQLGLGIEGVLDANLPAAIAPTIYARYPAIPAAIMLAIALILVVQRRMKRQKF